MRASLQWAAGDYREWRQRTGASKNSKDDALEKVLEVLDGSFAYDQRVQLPTDFESYFNPPATSTWADAPDLRQRA